MELNHGVTQRQVTLSRIGLGSFAAIYLTVFATQLYFRQHPEKITPVKTETKKTVVPLFDLNKNSIVADGVQVIHDVNLRDAYRFSQIKKAPEIFEGFKLVYNKN